MAMSGAMGSVECDGMYSKLINKEEEDTLYDEKNHKRESSDVQVPVPSAGAAPSSHLYRLATGCLGLLCVVFLISIVVLCAHYKNLLFGVSEEHDMISQNYSSAQSTMERLSFNVSALSDAISKLQKEKADLEKDRERLQKRVKDLEEEQVKPKICQPEWIQFNTSCYFISSTSKSWDESQGYCAERGGHLAIIDTPEEQTFLWNQLVRGHWNAYWFGISDEKAEGDWFWVDGTKLVGGFWMDGEPNNHIDEDCGYMVKTRNPGILALGSWYDAPCSMHWPWICEGPIS
ncbi:CD209 antigen-like protein E isoform X1 [Conger conger]|uniref:CD209 antigen-like protein E isoform X1 n=1 Tax=Conger conger TaxID=82655 RepID=UPI002A59E4C5|nr:CD209 antigen-like protein E isoform X1 [Conger conger]